MQRIKLHFKNGDNRIMKKFKNDIFSLKLVLFIQLNIIIYDFISSADNRAKITFLIALILLAIIFILSALLSDEANSKEKKKTMSAIKEFRQGKK